MGSKAAKKMKVELRVNAEKASAVVAMNIAAAIRQAAPETKFTFQETVKGKPTRALADIIPQQVWLKNLEVTIINEGENGL